MTPAGESVEVAWNPEFLALQGTLHSDRLVFEPDLTRPGRAEGLARELHADII